MIRGLTAGLFVLLGLAIGTPAGAADQSFAQTLDDMVTQLHKDPVLVQPVMGTGDTAGVHDLLAKLSDAVDVPVYVVLAATPPELAGAEQPGEQAAAVFHEALGDGLYIVHFNDGIGYVGGFGQAKNLDVTPGLRANTRAEKLGPEKYNQTTAVLEAALVLRSAAHPGKAISDSELRDQIDEPWAFVPTDSFDRADDVARRWVFTIAAGLAVLIGGLTLTRVATRNPLPAAHPSDTSQANAMPETAHTELNQIQQRFDRLTPADLGSPHGLAADEALQAAQKVIGTGDELDEVGAWVLALIAERELQRLRKPQLQAYRPCVVDPTHGEADGTLRLSGSSIDAPACHACTRQQGTFLAAHTWRGDRPYLDTRSVWARTGFGALVDDLARQVLDSRGGRR